MFSINKKFTYKTIIAFLILFATFFIACNNTNAITLQESKDEYSVTKLADTQFQINFMDDLIYFPNSNYSEYGIVIEYDQATRYNSNDGAYYYYYTNSYNVGYTVATGASMLYLTAPNIPILTTGSDNAYIWVKDMNNISRKYSLLGSTLYNAQPSCSTYVRVSGDKTNYQVYKCGVYNYYTKRVEYDSAIKNVENQVTCVPGYEKTTSAKLIQDKCAGVTDNAYGLENRLCSQVYEFTCTKKTAESARLSSLSLSVGTLSPEFNADTYVYSAEVQTDSVAISAELSAGASFVSGYGPRTVELNPGVNTEYIKISSSTGAVTTYTLKITNSTSLSRVNTLSSITTSVGTLSPEFASYEVNYDLFVPDGTTSVEINATRTDETSKFLDGYGSREVTLVDGAATAYIKVQSAAGTVKTYAIFIKTGDAPAENTTDALLKNIEIVDSDITIDFKENTYEYNVNVDKDTSYVLINAYAKDEGDTVNIHNVNELQMGSNIIEIEVTTPAGFRRVYTVNVIRNALEISTNPEIKSIAIKGYEFKYEPNELSYDLVLHKGDTELDITVVPEDDKSVVTIEGNKDLQLGSVIKVISTAEDGTVAEYVINITGIEKGSNTLLIVILVIVIALLLVYVVLRLLGYKIYFNFSLIGSAFRSLWEKIKNIFNR